MNLPSEFISNIQNTFQEDGYTFLKQLPDQIAEASVRWRLTNIRPVPALSFNFVAFAQRGNDNEEVILKMGVPNREFKSEMAALRLFNGEGACNLLEYDEEKYWMLLERLTPGVMLATLEDDEEATHIAAEVMQKIWRPVESLESASSLANSQEQNQKQASGLHNFIQLSDWFDGLKKLRPHFTGTTGPFDEKLVQRVEALVKDFFSENHKPVLMHGDYHHYNVLSSERGWLVIDPKGVIGPACYEVGPLLINPWHELIDRGDYRGLTRHRIDILHEHLGFERERIHAWGLAHAVLSAWWSIEDHGDWRFAASFAEMMAELNI